MTANPRPALLSSESVSSPPRTVPVETRLALQRRAAGNFRRHLFRAARRVVVLIVADLGTFELMRLALRSLRDQAAGGSDMARMLQVTLPTGYLGGWQFAAALVLGLWVTGNYAPGDNRRSGRQLLAGCAFAVALPLWLALWDEGASLVLFQYILTVFLVWSTILAERLLIDRVVALVLPLESRAARTLFVGPAAACRAAMGNRAFSRSPEHLPVGFVDLNAPAATDAVGSILDLPQLLQRSRAEAVVACGYLSDSQLQDVTEMALLAGCQLLSLPRTISVAGVQPAVVWRQGQPVVELSAPSLKGQQLFMKRTLDLIGAGVMLVLAAPLMLIAAIAIRLDSRGPIFFRQERIGTGGGTFRVWKFRTMVHGASDAAHRDLVGRMIRQNDPDAAQPAADGRPVYKLVNDIRVTRVGRWLRRTSLDELPQLFNVLKGDMSLVGPRPPLHYEFEAYDHWQYDRLQVRPGITGLWQVSGRNLLTYRQMCELDVEYVRRWSLYLDLKILLRTIPVVLFNSGRAA